MPWRLVQLLFIASVAGVSGLAFAEGVDLSKVDRSIRREPVWASGEQQYCLFVVSAERRVWFVVDGDDLYMDINENGDLTDPGEKLPRMDRSDEQRGDVRGSHRWRIPDINGADGEPLITNIKITPDTNSRAAANGGKFVYFDIPVYGRVHTRPTFADTPADAPILHPTGPHRLSLSVRRSYLPANRDVSNTFHVGGYKCVEGLGRGTRFALETVNLDCRIEFPLADGKTEVKEMRLQSYITGPYQTATASLPEGVDDDGTVKITLSRRREATGPVVAPVVVEMPVTKLRAVRRVTERDEAKLQRSITTQQQTLANESGDEAERQSATAQTERAAAQQILVTNHLLMGKFAHSEDDTAGALTWYRQAYRDAAPDDPRRVSARNLIGAWGGSLKQTLVHDHGVHTVAVSADARKLLAGYYNSRAQIWDLETGMPRGAPLPCGGDIVSAQFSPDGGFVLIGDWGGANVWDVATGELRYPTLEHEVREDTVLGPVLSPDGRSIVTRSPFTGIRIWDAETGKPRGESLPLGKLVGDMIFSPDSKRVAALGGGVVQVCDVETAKPVGEAFTDATGLAFHPTGRVVAVSHKDGKIVLRDLDSGQQIAELDHDKPLHSVKFDAEGKNLLCRDDENSYLWLDVLEDERTRRVLHHGRGLFTAVFSPTSDDVLTASSLKLRVWNVDGTAAGWERSVPPSVSRQKDYMNSVVFSPDGKSLLTLKKNDTAEVV